MKILVINKSGNVGKTTLAQEFLHPRLNNPISARFETINAAGDKQADIQQRAAEFRQFVEQFMLEDVDVIADVGSSNVESILEKLVEIEGAIHMFDAAVIPVTAEIKIQIDTVSMVQDLLDLGFPAEKIFVVTNMVPASILRDKNAEALIQDQFYKVINECHAMGVAVVGHIVRSDVFETAFTMQERVEDLASIDPQAAKAAAQEAKAAGDETETRRLTRVMTSAMMAKPVKANLDSVFLKLNLA